MKPVTLQNSLAAIKHYQRRVLAVVMIMIVLSAIIIARLFYLQLLQYNYYLSLSRQNLLTIAPIDPSRGLIYDRHGVLIAGNMPVFSLDVMPDNVKNLNEMIKELTPIVNLTPTDIQAFEKQLEQHRKFNPVPLKIKLNNQQMAAFALNKYRFPGFFIRTDLVRYYPYGPLLEPVLGYVGRINAKELAKVDAANYSASNYIGKSGVEKYYETQLHGTVGVQQEETTAGGEVVRSTQNRPAIAGENLYLSIDVRLQAAIQQIMQGKIGAVVAIDPRNGQVLAMVSNPSFDPNLFVTGISNKDYQVLHNDPDKPLYNRALQGEFPPGSTVKPFYALKALSDNLVAPGDGVFCQGTYQLPGSSHVYHDWQRRGHGWVDADKAIIQSCDVYFFRLAVKIGIAELDAALTQVGLGQATGIDISGERTGLVPTPAWKKKNKHEIWFPGDTVITGIGQGFTLVTPLQMATAIMRVVERGGGYQPHFLLRGESPEGNIIPFKPVPYTPVPASQAAWELVMQAMDEVVSSPWGTGYNAGHTAAYTFGGKSGTAQVFSLKDNQRDKAHLLPAKLRDHSWFISFAPTDHPQVVMAIFLEHGGEGAASYVARQIYDSYFQLQQTNTNKGNQTHQ